MRIIATSDWHLGNLFHGNDRLPEHRHFLQWLLQQLRQQRPDALLVAGDVFDNGNPSAAAQSAYYEFLADATQVCPDMHIIITAGNHDSASRIEAPRPLLARHKVQVRGMVKRRWQATDDGGAWVVDFDDLMIPVSDGQGRQLVVLAVPYLRSDVVQDPDYSRGVATFLQQLTARARQRYPGLPLLMMAHLYARGAAIAATDASEKIVVGGLEEVSMHDWPSHPDYLTCGHIHKRQPVWGTSWARYTGSVLPMSFAEKDYLHGVDLISFGTATDDADPHCPSPVGHAPSVTHLAYEPQHRLRMLPDDDAGLTPARLKRLISAELPDRPADGLDDTFEYVMLKVKLDKASADDIRALEELVSQKNAVLCKIQKVMPQLDIATLNGEQTIGSVDDILNRDPMDTLREAFVIHHQQPLNERQEALLCDVINSIHSDSND